MQNDPVIKVTLGGFAAGGARIIDGDLEVRKATYYRGELGSWGNWLEVGQNAGDVGSADYAGERGVAYQFRYRIKSEYNVWSNYAEPGTTVRINAAPVAVGGTDTSAETGKKVPFDGTRSWDPDGDSVVSFEWDFGDGKKDTKGATSHSYRKAGVLRRHPDRERREPELHHRSVGQGTHAGHGVHSRLRRRLRPPGVLCRIGAGRLAQTQVKTAGQEARATTAGFPSLAPCPLTRDPSLMPRPFNK